MVQSPPILILGCQKVTTYATQYLRTDHREALGLLMTQTNDAAALLLCSIEKISVVTVTT